jgi:hypothetical protein
MRKITSLILTAVIVFLAFPKTTHAAGSLYLTPSSGNLTVGKNFQVVIYADSKGQDINTAEANLIYSTDTLELINVIQGSVFFLSTPASPNYTADRVYVGGGLPSPGYNGNRGELGVLTFKPKKAGNAFVRFENGHILLNNGAGTDVLSETFGAQFTVTADTTAPSNLIVNLVGENDTEHSSTTPTIEFSATDNESGIDHYEIYLNDALITAAAVSPFTFSKQESGGFLIKVIAVDKAGNSTSSLLPIVIPAPSIIEVPVEVPVEKPGEEVPVAGYFKKFVQDPIYLLLFGIMMMIGIFGFMFLRQRKDETTTTAAVQMAMLQMEIDRVLQFEFDLTRMRQDLDLRFQNLPEQLTSQVQGEIDRSIQREIDKNVAFLTAKINSQFEALSRVSAKDLEKLRAQLEEKIQSDIDKNTKLLESLARRVEDPNTDATYRDVSSRIEILKRVQNEISGSKYVSWRGRKNPDNE